AERGGSYRRLWSRGGPLEGPKGRPGGSFLGTISFFEGGQTPAAQAAASSEASSSGVSCTWAAATFSSRWATDPVPGIGRIAGEWARSQASATWAGVASWALATLATGPDPVASWPVFKGNHG